MLRFPGSVLKNLPVDGVISDAYAATLISVSDMNSIDRVCENGETMGVSALGVNLCFPLLENVYSE